MWCNLSLILLEASRHDPPGPGAEKNQRLLRLNCSPFCELVLELAKACPFLESIPYWVLIMMLRSGKFDPVVLRTGCGCQRGYR